LSSEPPILLSPEDYDDWRKSYLGTLTEQIEREAVFGLAGPLRSKRVLDIGCGDGTYAIAASTEGATVAAADISARMLSSARRRAEKAGVTVDWCQASAERLPFTADVFDAVLAVTALCVVSDPQQAVQEAARVLRPGGVFIIGDLGKYSSWALSRTVRGWLGTRRWGQARFWSLSELQRLVVQSGLVFRSGRGAIYYPRITNIAKLIGAHDQNLSRLGQFGAAFLTLRAEKPR
jgi:ubiquinone/menaquinone biosynthesis C-methylase UbiE